MDKEELENVLDTKSDVVFIDYAFCRNCKKYQWEKDIKQNWCGYSSTLKRKPTDTCGCFILDENVDVSTLESINKPRKQEIEYMFEPSFFQVNEFLDNINYFYRKQPFFYDSFGIYWFWNKDQFKWVIVDEVDIMIQIERILKFHGQTINSRIKQGYIDAIKRIGRENKPKESYKRWIQFKDKAYSLRSSNIYNVTPDYFFVNPIPWEVSKSKETPIIDKLFKEWVGEKYVKTLYEIIAYCCYTDYPLQIITCLYGSGRNGKSCFIRLLTKFLGQNNVCSTELDRLTGLNSSRFESIKLYKKLVCLMGETNFGVLQSTSMLKKLTGGDMIDYEIKGKMPFNEYSYAKLIISSNSLPPSTDTSDGFYRRWILVPFMNEFPEGKDILSTIPEYEYNNLAYKCCELLKEVLNKGEITNQGTIEERKQNYIMASNPLGEFIKTECKQDVKGWVTYNDLYMAYLSYLKKNKHRRISRKEFKVFLEDEGYSIERTSKTIGNEYIRDFYINGLILSNLSNLSTNLHISGLYMCAEGKNSGENGQNGQKIDEIIFLQCSVCGNEQSNNYTKTGKPVCNKCIAEYNLQTNIMN